MLLYLGARCIVIVSWLVASGLYGAVSRGFHVASLDVNLGSEKISGLTMAVFKASQARLGTLDDTLLNVTILPESLGIEASASARVSDADERRLQQRRRGLSWRIVRKWLVFRAVGALVSPRWR